MADIPGPVDRGRIQRALRRLDAREREVLRLSAGEGLGFDAIADRLGTSLRETQKLLALALCKLDRALERGTRPWWRIW